MKERERVLVEGTHHLPLQKFYDMRALISDATHFADKTKGTKCRFRMDPVGARLPRLLPFRAVAGLLHVDLGHNARRHVDSSR